MASMVGSVTPSRPLVMMTSPMAASGTRSDLIRNTQEDQADRAEHLDQPMNRTNRPGRGIWAVSSRSATTSFIRANEQK